MRDLVSIAVPAYNDAERIPKLLESIIEQTYPSIELLIINDGSTDDTVSVIESFRLRIEARNYTMRVFTQTNQGQASAIDLALKLFKGDYFTWIDSDDWLTKLSIEARVNFLKKNQNYGFVRGDGILVNNDEKNTPIEKYSSIYNLNKTDIFMDLLYVRDLYFSGGYMVKTKILLEAIPTREINKSREGQNWQLLIPISKNNECGFLNEIVFYQLARSDSHSRAIKNLAPEIQRSDGHLELVLDVLDSIGMRSEFERLVVEIYNRKKMHIYSKYLKICAVNKYFFKIKNKNMNDYKILIKSYIRYLFK